MVKVVVTVGLGVGLLLLSVVRPSGNRSMSQEKNDAAGQSRLIEKLGDSIALNGGIVLNDVELIVKQNGFKITDMGFDYKNGMVVLGNKCQHVNRVKPNVSIRVENEKGKFFVDLCVDVIQKMPNDPVVDVGDRAVISKLFLDKTLNERLMISGVQGPFEDSFRFTSFSLYEKKSEETLPKKEKGAAH
jgi:hypothetical protein